MCQVSVSYTHLQLIAVPASLIKVVQHSDHRFPLSPEFAHQPHQVHLVIDIKIGGWPRIRPLYYLMSQPPILISITRWT